MLKRALLIAAAGAALVALTMAIGAWRWHGVTRRMRERLEAARLPVQPEVYEPDRIEGLPEPVRRYFRKVLVPGQPLVAALDVAHTGTFNLSESGEDWKPFGSTQRVTVRRPGFDWNARIALLPGFPIRVHDAYIAGEGILHAAVLGLLTVAERRGTQAFAEDELMRYLAEAAWYPTALLPSQGVVWEAVDGSSARATLRDGDTAATLLFRFDTEGLIESVRSEGRGRAAGGRSVLTPWEGMWHRYERRGGMLIPTEGEVAWILPGGPHFYWHGLIQTITYEFAE